MAYTAGATARTERFDPGMAPHGWQAVRFLKSSLPEQINAIYVGMGKRHWDLACALGFDEGEHGRSLHFSECWGSGAVWLEGPVSGEPLVVLPFGKTISAAVYDGGDELKRMALERLKPPQLPDNCVVCTDAHTLGALINQNRSFWGAEEFKAEESAAYEVTVAPVNAGIKTDDHFLFRLNPRRVLVAT